MGFLADLFGMGGKKDAKTAKNASRWQPGAMNVGGATFNYDRGNPASGIPGSGSVALSPEQQLQYNINQGLAGAGAGGMFSALQPSGVPGYNGVTPQLYNEFRTSNQGAGPQIGGVANPYQMQQTSPGAIRGASFDSSGMPQVGMVNMAGAPQAGGSVNWNGKAESLDKQYLDKSSAFLNASNPVTGFDGVAKDWYNTLTDLSREQDNNMLQGTADKAFLRGILNADPGSQMMQAAQEAFYNQDLERKLAGYQVGADASQRNLSQALAAGGYVQQNDATRLQQAIAQGQIDAASSQANLAAWMQGQGLNQQGQMANAGNWLTGQGMGLQAQGMNQNADAQNLANWFQQQGMLQSQGEQQIARDLGYNQQQLAVYDANQQRANQRFLNAMNMFGTGQTATQGDFGRGLAAFGAGSGGMMGYDQYLANLMGLGANIGAQQSGANAQAYGIPVQVGMNTSNYWGNMANAAATAYAGGA